MNYFQLLKPPRQEKVKILSLYGLCASFLFFQSKCCPFFSNRIDLGYPYSIQKISCFGAPKKVLFCIFMQ